MKRINETLVEVFDSHKEIKDRILKYKRTGYKVNVSNSWVEMAGIRIHIMHSNLFKAKIRGYKPSGVNFFYAPGSDDLNIARVRSRNVYVNSQPWQTYISKLQELVDGKVKEEKEQQEAREKETSN